VTPGKKFEVRFVSSFAGESVCILNFMKDGQSQSSEIIGPESYRTLSFKKENEMQKKTYAPTGDEFIVTVTKGELIIIFRPLE